ncbi:MAG: aminotransferase class I/II-fold pyridoxal phosphate-dependent enzyme [Puniceicoccales bacterium]|nr:aminotransferase class I/II-fold pyridoxal phosphate-dependent enzyme [Puniceicoccales bacterium]
MSQRIYLSPPHLSGEEQGFVREAFDTNWVAPLGPNVESFEREVCESTGAKAAVALSSGTAAIHLALRLLGVGPGDIVVCQSLTFAASANPILYQGAVPFFVDSEEASWNLCPNLLDEALSRLAAKGTPAKAVISVDILGQCADYDNLRTVCARHNVPLVQDAAEAMGSTHRGVAAGRQGAFGIYSFNGNKIITTSGGGMLLGDDPESIARARFLATQARDPAPHYQHTTFGYNYRLSNVLAGIGRGQLRVLGARVAARRANERLYRELLAGIPGVEFMPEAPWGISNRWLTHIQIDATKTPRNATSEDARLALEARNIESRPLWKPLHAQPVFAAAPTLLNGVADRLFERGLSLPSGSALTPPEIARVAAVIRETLAG